MPPADTLGPGRRFTVGPALPLLPFLLFVLVFLVVPTVTVVVGAFQDEDGRPTLGNLDALTSEAALTALRGSLILSGSIVPASAIASARTGRAPPLSQRFCPSSE